MLIKEFSLPEDVVRSFGLSEIRMPRLGKFIAIAGKNGAGKSRQLSTLTAQHL